jgi:hypothetical protein
MEVIHVSSLLTSILILTGHEPDNEDSDNSDGQNGDYLKHDPYEDYGAFRGPSYYNYEHNFNRNMSRDDM